MKVTRNDRIQNQIKGTLILRRKARTTCKPCKHTKEMEIRNAPYT